MIDQEYRLAVYGLCLAVGVLLLLAGCFLIGETFGRKEVIREIPHCRADEYIYIKSTRLRPESSSDLGCLQFTRRP